MNQPFSLSRLIQQLKEELGRLSLIKSSDRPWQMPFAAALASGLPLLVGAYFGRMDYGVISSLGGLVFLYLPETPLHHRLVVLMACAFAMTASYTLGIASHLWPASMMPALTFSSVLATLLCRFYRIGPPGSLFFVMAASIAAYSPSELMEVPLKVGLLSLGCLLASLIAFFYSLFMLRRRPAQALTALPPASFEFVVFDSVVIGAFVGLSLAVAQLLKLENAYWVPISCLAVIQGLSLRAIWEKQVHRLIGTGIGLLFSGFLLSLPLDAWRLAALIIALVFVIENLVVRHYGIAAVFITPLTLLLAEAPHLGEGHIPSLIEARFIDTLLGCGIGLLGGFCLHHPVFRAKGLPLLRRLLGGIATLKP